MFPVDELLIEKLLYSVNPQDKRYTKSTTLTQENENYVFFSVRHNLTMVTSWETKGHHRMICQILCTHNIKLLTMVYKQRNQWKTPPLEFWHDIQFCTYQKFQIHPWTSYSLTHTTPTRDKIKSLWRCNLSKRPTK